MVLGVLQGATEFLPISSSAHLLLIPWLLGWVPLGLAFDVLLHSGTMISLLVYFRHDWKEIGAQTIFRKRSVLGQQHQLGLILLISTVPAALVGGLLKDFIEGVLRSPATTALTLSSFGLLLWWADRTGAQSRRVTDLSPQEGLIIGMAQALALVPGVSRSGVTITAALLLGLSRTEAARFSFLLGTPIIVLATLSQVHSLWTLGEHTFVTIFPLLIGILFSSISGFLCITFFLRFLRRNNYFPFVVYRLLLAFLILWFLVE